MARVTEEPLTSGHILFALWPPVQSGAFCRRALEREPGLPCPVLVLPSWLPLGNTRLLKIG